MLKKILLVAGVFILLEGLASATTSYVDITDAALMSPTGEPGIVYRPSNKVKLFYLGDAATQAQNYTIGAKHDSGNRTYSTSNLSTAIYYKEDTTVKDGVTLTGHTDILPTVAGESNYGSGWTGM